MLFLALLLFDDHDDLISRLGRLFVYMHHGCGNVDGMGGIRLVDDYDVGGYIFQMITCYSLPENSSNSLSYCFSVLFSLSFDLRFL